MTVEQHKENLKKYIEEDVIFREPIKNMSDFDKYCYNHCKDIEAVLTELDKDTDRIDELINEVTIKDIEINKLKYKIKNSIYILKHNIKQFEEYSDSELEEWLNNFDKCAIKKGDK